MTEPRQIGIARTHDELVDLLAARKEELGLSNAFIDAYWSYASGMTDKYLGPTRVKTLGRQSIDDFLMILGLDIVLVESPDKLKRMETQYEQRKPGYAHSPRVSKAAVQRARPVVLSEMGRNGGLKRIACQAASQASKIGRKGGRIRAKSLTKEQRVAIARAAAVARWKKVREAERIAALQAAAAGTQMVRCDENPIKQGISCT